MFFVDMPFISGILFLVIADFGKNIDGAWLAFLLIPLYYAVAVLVLVTMKKEAKKNNKQSD